MILEILPNRIQMSIVATGLSSVLNLQHYFLRTSVQSILIGDDDPTGYMLAIRIGTARVKQT
jgi:hypothetical protein